MHSCTILSCNRNGDNKRNAFCLQSLFKNYHITCLQETSFPTTFAYQAFQAQANSQFKNFVFVNDSGATGACPSPGKHGGICTILHADFFGAESATHPTHLDVCDRYMVVQVMWGTTEVFIHNVYAPVRAQERTEFFDSLPRSFDDGSIHIVCGDLNTPLDPVLDSQSPNGYHRSSHQALLNWTWDLRVVDPWRIHFPDERVYSGPGRVNRLDYILVSHGVQEQYFHSAQYRPSEHCRVVVSDHLLPTLTLRAAACAQRPGPWRAPKWMLDDPDIQEWILQQVRSQLLQIERSDNPGFHWQKLKRSLRSQLIQRQQSYTQPSLRRLQECEDRLLTLLHQATETPDGYDDALSAATEAVDDARSDYNKVRADINFKRDLVESENGTLYFFRPPTNSLNRSPICAVTLPSGETGTAPWLVQHTHWKFWGGVFGHDGSKDSDLTDDDITDARDTLFSHSKERLAEDAKTELDTELCIDDFVTAIKSMSPFKAPGHDGIPAKVYLLDPHLFARILLRVFQDQARRGVLSSDQRRSIVCLLHKKGDRSVPANYRPISLIPVDVKIFARVLTNRVRPLMNSLIHRDQAGFVKGRHIQHPLLAMYDLQELVTQLGHEAYATMIDFEKAYDRVSWNYLWSVLRHFNFGEQFIQWVKLLYTQTEVCLNVNGNVLEAIRPSRGVKQGDPLSPLLFILALEPLCCAIRAHPEYGLHLPNLPPATGTYFADDATLFSHSLTQAAKQLDIVQLYCASSGAKLNIAKTTVLALNRGHSQHIQTNMRVLGPDESVRYLGLPIGQRIYHSDRLNSINTKFYSQFSIWKWRAKTLVGRKILAQALMASQLWYCSAVTHIPPQVLAEWQRALNNFVVRSLTEPTKGPLMIAQEWVYHSPERVTLQLPNVERFVQRQRLNLLQQLVDSRHLHDRSFGWYSIPLSQLTALLPPTGRRNLADFLWIPLSRKWFSNRPGCLNSWWVEVMMTWKAWTKTLNVETLPAPERQRIYLTAPLWYNRYPSWRYQSNPARAASKTLWETSNPLVRRSLAASGFWTLQDFLTPDLRWPSLEVFATAVTTATELPDPQTRNIAFLHHQLTQVFTRLFPHGIDMSAIDHPQDPLKPLWPWRTSTPRKTYWFPTIPSKMLYRSLADTTEPKTRHPFQRHVPAHAPSTDELEQHARSLRKLISPRTFDVTLRVWWRILPTHYFFWRQGDPTQRYCVHGCQEIETYRHLFWECQHSSNLWRIVLTQWHQILDRPASWSQALFGLDLPLKRRWQRHHKGILIAWNVTRSIVFSLIWKNRNQWKHQQEHPPDPRSQLPIVEHSLHLHMRQALNHAMSNGDQELLQSLISINAALSRPHPHQLEQDT